jgi:hypothetical protein
MSRAMAATSAAFGAWLLRNLGTRRGARGSTPQGSTGSGLVSGPYGDVAKR